MSALLPGSFLGPSLADARPRPSERAEGARAPGSSGGACERPAQAVPEARAGGTEGNGEPEGPATVRGGSAGSGPTSRTTTGPTTEPPASPLPLPGGSLEGRLLAGRYLVGQVLGTGAMGYVYRAQHVDLGRKCAVKVIRPRYDLDPEHPDDLDHAAKIARFRVEALAASRLDHDNVLRVLDFGCEPEDSLWYLVTEHLDGRDLVDVLAEEAPLSTRRIVTIMSQVCAALEHAHARRVVHRDVKPENVRLMREVSGRPGPIERVKLLDFGTAKILDAVEGDGCEGLVLGTPAYMSPEQASGEAVDHRSDLYSCGVLLFEMATGSLPFERESALALAAAHVESEPPRPSERHPEIDPELESLILFCLEKDPGRRPQSARELALALERLVGARGEGRGEPDGAGARGDRPSRTDLLLPPGPRRPARPQAGAGQDVSRAGAVTPPVSAPRTGFGASRAGAEASPGSGLPVSAGGGREEAEALDRGIVPDVNHPATPVPGSAEALEGRFDLHTPAPTSTEHNDKVRGAGSPSGRARILSLGLALALGSAAWAVFGSDESAPPAATPQEMAPAAAPPASAEAASPEQAAPAEARPLLAPPGQTDQTEETAAGAEGEAEASRRPAQAKPAAPKSVKKKAPPARPKAPSSRRGAPADVAAPAVPGPETPGEAEAEAEDGAPSDGERPASADPYAAPSAAPETPPAPPQKSPESPAQSEAPSPPGEVPAPAP